MHGSLSLSLKYSDYMFLMYSWLISRGDADGKLIAPFYWKFPGTFLGKDPTSWNLPRELALLSDPEQSTQLSAPYSV